MRSVDQGLSWGGREVVVDSPLDDRNGAIGIDSDGNVVVGYAIFDSYDAAGNLLETPRAIDTYVVLSGDGGVTWSSPRRVDSGPYRLMSPYGRITTLPDGRLIMAVYVGGGVPGPWAAAYIESSDGGRTWVQPRIIDVHHDETSIIALPGGIWLVAMRNEGSTGITFVRSEDSGRTWGVRLLVTMQDEVPGDLVALDDSTVWLTYGRRHAPFGVSGRLSVDGGRSWSDPVVLAADGLDDDVGYPSSVLVGPGEVLTAYYEEASRDFPADGLHAAVLHYKPLAVACGSP